VLAQWGPGGWEARGSETGPRSLTLLRDLSGVEEGCGASGPLARAAGSGYGAEREQSSARRRPRCSCSTQLGPMVPGHHAGRKPAPGTHILSKEGAHGGLAATTYSSRIHVRVQRCSTRFWVHSRSVSKERNQTSSISSLMPLSCFFRLS